jgi:ABC-2 type transport system permease protein
MVIRMADGTLKEDESELGTVAAFIVPIVLVMLMFVIVIVGATPLTMNVVEEKQLRIAEVLLGSVTPFQLMLGKLIGGACVAVTLAAIYLAGAYFVATRAGYQNYVNPVTLLWFVFFCVLSIFMYGSLFLAAGAAVSNMKEAQSMVMPVTILFALPLVILGALLQQPNSPLALGATFFPFSSPVATVVRIAVPPGVPAWQPLVAAAITVLTTIVIVWAAGRIFRVGILMQGQGAKLGEMLRWVVRG